MLNKILINWTCHITRGLTGLAATTIISILAIFLMGETGWLNNFLSSSAMFIRLTSVDQSADPIATWTMLQNYYGTTIMLMVVCMIVLGVMIFFATIKMLSIIGRLIFKLGGAKNWSDSNRLFLTSIIVWTIAILSVWAVLNIPSTFSTLLFMVVLMLVNLLFIWITTKLSNKWEIHEL